MSLSTFITYDLIFLALSIILVVFFLYRRKQKLERQGILYLYRTQVGVKFIDKFAKKFDKILKPLQYFIVFWGYVLMALIIYLFSLTIYIYLKAPATSPLAKIPAVFPLIPYFPQILHIQSFFPPFYFTYFIVSIAIVAVVHEFSHGIFMRLNKIKIKSTGFAFLGPFLGAFVEQDDKQMNKAKKFPQLSILAAGTFANTLMVVLFGLVLLLFFFLAFSPAGVYFTPAYNAVNVSEISGINNVMLGNTTFLEITSNNNTYFTTLDARPSIVDKTVDFIVVFESAPAFNSQLTGAISEFDGKKVTSYDSLRQGILSKNPGDTVDIKTISDGITNDYNVTLADNSGKAFLGIAPLVQARSNFASKLSFILNWGEDPNVYYISHWGNFGIFIKYLLWWIIFINLAVALSNMIPAGIFDGGHFFHLTVQGITKSKKFANVLYRIVTWIIIAALILLMLKWVFNLI